MRMLSWNVRAQNGESPTTQDKLADRNAAIAEIAERARKKEKISVLSLTDTENWRDTYETNEAIAAHLGFASVHTAHTVQHNNESNRRTEIDIVVATDHHVAETLPLNGHNFLGLSVVLDVGTDGLQLVPMHFATTNPQERRATFAAIQEGLHDMPTILLGNFVPTPNRFDRFKNFWGNVFDIGEPPESAHALHPALAAEGYQPCRASKLPKGIKPANYPDSLYARSVIVQPHLALTNIPNAPENYATLSAIFPGSAW